MLEQNLCFKKIVNRLSRNAKADENYSVMQACRPHDRIVVK